MRKSDIRDCLSAHLETKLEFAYTVVASLQVWPDPCLNFVNLTHPRAGRQYLPVCGDPPKSSSPILWSLRSRYGPTPF